jgi:hypothetical protein
VGFPFRPLARSKSKVERSETAQKAPAEGRRKKSKVECSEMAQKAPAKVYFLVISAKYLVISDMLSMPNWC